MITEKAKRYMVADGSLMGIVPGGYPVMYMTDFGNLLCATCATETMQDEYETIMDGLIYYEGDSLFCDECNAEIESAYGVLD